MNLQTRYSLAIFLVFAGWAGIAKASDCDAAYVDSSYQGRVIVQPNGVDDSNTIQCAIDLAVEEERPVIVLAAGQFYVSKRIEVENYFGAIRGQGQSRTTLYLDVKHHCDLYVYEPASRNSALRIHNGNVKISWLTIEQLPDEGTDCNRPMASIWVSSDETCENDIVFFAMDRVTMRGPGLGDPNTNYGNGDVTAVFIKEWGPLFWEEDSGVRSCKLKGQVSINRVTVEDYLGGIRTTMFSGSKVDYTYNKFIGNLGAIQIIGGNQITSIIGNEFIIGPGSWQGIWGSDHYAVSLGSEPYNPTDNILNFTNNTVTEIASEDGTPYGSAPISLYVSPKIDSRYKISLTGNTFSFNNEASNRRNGPPTCKLTIWSTDNGVISENKFKGDAGSASIICLQEVGSAGFVGAPDGWFISNNIFSASSAADIALEGEGHIIGPGQSPSLECRSTNHYFLDPELACP